MAEKKFSELTAKGATIADTDIVAISESAGGGTYTSKSVTGANIKALVTDANMTTTDITTNDVSTSKHGFAPKAPNDTTKFLRGDATWAVVPAGGLTKFTEAEATTSPNNTVYVDSLTAAGSTTNVDVAIVPKGTGALLAQVPDNTATGGNKRGTYAVDWQTARTSATQIASANYSSILGGRNNTASGTHASNIGGLTNVSSGDNSVTGGYINTASNDSAIAIGYTNTSSNICSMSFGESNTSSGYNSFCAGRNNTGSANYSSAIGFGNISNAVSSHSQGYYSHVFGIYGRKSYASGREATTGDAQYSKFILRIRTTGNTATTVTTDAQSATTTNQVILENQSAYRFKGTIIGKKSGTTDIASWDIDGLIARGANAASTTLNVSNVTLVQNTPAWGTPTLAADTTNGGLRVQVTGAAATNIQWTAVIETTEVIYA